MAETNIMFTKLFFKHFLGILKKTVFIMKKLVGAGADFLSSAHIRKVINDAAKLALYSNIGEFYGCKSLLCPCRMYFVSV